MTHRPPLNAEQMKCQLKNRYVSERVALLQAARAEVDRGAVLHVYRCPHCKGWHLTSRKQKQRAPAHA